MLGDYFQALLSHFSTSSIMNSKMADSNYDARKFTVCAPWNNQRGGSWTEIFHPKFEDGLRTHTDNFSTLHETLVTQTDYGGSYGPPHPGGANAKLVSGHHIPPHISDPTSWLHFRQSTSLLRPGAIPRYTNRASIASSSNGDAQKSTFFGDGAAPCSFLPCACRSTVNLNKNS